MRSDSSPKTSAGISRSLTTTAKPSPKGSSLSISQKVSTYFTKDDNFLIRIPPSQQAEAYVAKVATANINAKLIISQANNVE